MYKNIGDADFFRYGRLLKESHSDMEFDIICCDPYSDREDLFRFGDLHVDINDSWIDADEVMNFIGMDRNNFDSVQFALGCIGFYGYENFGAYYSIYDWKCMTRKDIEEILKGKEINLKKLKEKK